MVYANARPSSRAGLLLSARAGSGLVIARLPDGSFSAPSAIGTAGMGFGAQWGAELTEFLVVLNTTSAIESFMSSGSLTVGGNLSIAVGPLGRNGEAMGSLNTKGRMVTMYSYSKTKGLFSGISLESSVIGETRNTTVAKVVADLVEFSAARQDANAIAYQMDVTPQQLLSGAVSPPRWADALIQTITQAIGDPTPDPSRLSGSPTQIATDKERVEIPPPAMRPSQVPSTEPPLAEGALSSKDQVYSTPSRAPNKREWDSDPSESESLKADIDRARDLPERRSSNDQAPPGAVKAIALVDHFATEGGDLAFNAGDEIYVLEKTESADDWWVGMLAGQANQRGVFPGNYVKLTD
ncbi:hypothetical protein FRC05_001016 [Tulasnella sp. 425]|nr:hypothetical protein FRC05_001016 [Tulasnella sp. 425]